MATNHQREAAFDPEALYQQLLQAGDRPRIEEDEVHLTVEEILDYAFERLSSEDVARIDEHLDSGCEDCLNDMESVLELVSPWVGPVSTTPQLLSALADRLGDPVWNTRLSAASIVAAIGPVAATARILDGLLAMLGDDRPWVRDGAVEVFEDLGLSAATPAVERALEMLVDPATDSQIRSSALQAARATSTPGADADEPRRGILRYRATPERLANLVEPLSGTEILVREAAIEALAELGASAAEPTFLTSLVQMLQGQSEDVRSAAVDALSAIGPAAATPEVVAALSEALHSTDESVRRLALFTLDAFGPVVVRLTQLPSSGSDQTSASGPEVYRRAEEREREQLPERPAEAGRARPPVATNRSSTKSRFGPDFKAAGDVLSDLVEVCVLSEFALQPRSGMRLHDSAMTTERKGGAFKIPMSVLLGRAGVDLPVEPIGTVSLIASEDSGGRIGQVRVTASRDAEFPKSGVLELVLVDDAGHRVPASLTPDDRTFVIQTDHLSGSAKSLRLKLRPS